MLFGKCLSEVPGTPKGRLVPNFFVFLMEKLPKECPRSHRRSILGPNTGHFALCVFMCVCLRACTHVHMHTTCACVVRAFARALAGTCREQDTKRVRPALVPVRGSNPHSECATRSARWLSGEKGWRAPCRAVPAPLAVRDIVRATSMGWVGLPSKLRGNMRQRSSAKPNIEICTTGAKYEQNMRSARAPVERLRGSTDQHSAHRPTTPTTAERQKASAPAPPRPPRWKGLPSPRGRRRGTGTPASSGCWEVAVACVQGSA